MGDVRTAFSVDVTAAALTLKFSTTLLLLGPAVDFRLFGYALLAGFGIGGVEFGCSRLSHQEMTLTCLR